MRVYIYICVCVCVCMCVLIVLWVPDKISYHWKRDLGIWIPAYKKKKKKNWCLVKYFINCLCCKKFYNFLGWLFDQRILFFCFFFFLLFLFFVFCFVLFCFVLFFFFLFCFVLFCFFFFFFVFFFFVFFFFFSRF